MTGLAAAARGADGFELRAGAVAIGARGAFTTVEGTTSGSLGIGAGYHGDAGPVLVRYGVSVDYRRVADLDALAFEGSVVALLRLGTSSAYLFSGPALGTREEWVGSFSQATFPVGADAGLIGLVSAGGAFTVAYQYRRIIDDPVNDYNEHRVVLGLSLLLRNQGGESQ